MMRMLGNLKRWLPDIMAMVGGICLVIGAYICHPAAGWLVAGAVAIAAAVILSRGGVAM